MLAPLLLPINQMLPTHSMEPYLTILLVLVCLITCILTYWHAWHRLIYEDSSCTADYCLPAIYISVGRQCATWEC